MATFDAYDAGIGVTPLPGDATGAMDVTTDAYIAYLGNTSFTYYLAMFDNSNVRHYWTDFLPVTTNAPALGGGTYQTGTLCILLRVTNQN